VTAKDQAPWRFFHPSNAVTYVSCLAATAALVLTRESRSLSWAGLCLTVSVIADIWDGKFARLFKRRAELAKFGVEIDSLTDELAFGVVPVACLLLASAPGGAGETLAFWLSASVYILCAMTRLGAFNVFREETTDFTGLPTPGAAMAWSLAFLFHPSPRAAAILLVTMGFAMILPFRIPKPRGAALAVLVAAAATLVALHAAALVRR
jgi:CDP-diacylglycerol--serine O-phosphatidyltransferase